MTNKTELCSQDRRQFLSTIIPVCAFSCFGFKYSFSTEPCNQNQQQLPFDDRIKKEYCKSHEDAWRWRYGYYINTMKGFAKYLGRDKILELLKKVNDDEINMDLGDNPEHTLVNFIKRFKAKDYYNNTLTFKIIEESEMAFELRVTECLWAKTFIKENAGDIGYATICYGDFASAKIYHPKLKLRLTKTLMQGYECCNHRYTWEG